MMKDLSVLIPTFNDCCAAMVSELQRQAAALSIGYEVIVADDGSTDQAVIEANRAINELPHCRVIERGFNSGRAAIRNFLAQEACYPWLVFIDSDMVVCRHDYLRQYALSPCDSVTDGGVQVGEPQAGNLRYLYEKTCEPEHTVAARRQAPYKCFRTTNFMVRRDLMLAHPFDERFRYYGYEDVLFGKHLQEHAVDILHIDNPMRFQLFEPNDRFLGKTEEGLRTLHTFRHELQGYSHLLDVVSRLAPFAPLIRLFYKYAGSWLHRQLTGNQPRLLHFKLYRLGYYLSL